MNYSYIFHTAYFFGENKGPWQRKDTRALAPKDLQLIENSYVRHIS